MGSWQRDGSTATHPRRVFGIVFPPTPSSVCRCLTGQLSPTIKHKNPREASWGERGHGAGTRARSWSSRGVHQESEQFLWDHFSPCSELWIWTCRWQRDEERLELELFPQPPPLQSIILPQISTSSCSSPGAVPAPIMGCPGARPRVPMSVRGSELSVLPPRVRLEQLRTQQKAAGMGEGFAPLLRLSHGFTLTRSAPGRPVIIYFQHLQRSMRARQCRIQ